MYEISMTSMPETVIWSHVSDLLNWSIVAGHYLTQDKAILIKQEIMIFT